MPQSLATIRIHLIFSTKGRVCAIKPEIEPELHAYMAETLKSLDSPAVCIGGTEDHVHVLFSLSKSRALIDVIEKVKKGTSKWIKTKGPAFRTFYWQVGYAAFSIGKSNEAALVRYIHNQKKHHRKTDFKVELKAFLDRYGVDYDETYLWD
ncbi:MAG: IS200/IS605 family transposase [Planctomycetes bacterium]|nr:IS200/IS605 family transposase [Planctomycetota bacterium]